MSLDTVELVMEVEEQFDITIRDEDGEKILTIGDLYRYILDRVDFGTHVRCPSSAAFYRLRRAFVGSLGVSRDRVRPATPLEDLVPRSGRRKGWRRLKRAFGVGLPGLRRPKPLGKLVASAWWASALVALAVWVIGFHAVPAEAAVVAVSVAAVSAQVGALWMTRPLAVEFAPGCLTVRQLVGSLVDARRERSLPVGRAWDRETVWVALLTVVSEVAGVERGMLTEQTSFVYDLGMD